MILGIDYDMWHGILAFVISLTMIFILGNKYKSYVVYLVSFLFVFVLQSVNELVQMFGDLTPYGGATGFLVDSAGDWIYFILGCISAWLTSAILYGIGILKLR